MSAALLVEFYQQLPERREKEGNEEWKRRFRAAASSFKKQVGGRYLEGTLLRLLDSSDTITRRASVLALSLLGTMVANEAVAARLHDEDDDVRRLASDALWKIWFRGDAEANNLELQRLRCACAIPAEARWPGSISSSRRAPHFAEAYNQRAIVAFSMKQYERSIVDCAKALELNPLHFGAQAGIGQCYLQMRKQKSALKAFRQALRINPNLDGIAETIRALEASLGDDGRRDEKK